MKRMVDVKILGQTFTVASEERDEHLRRVAQLVDKKMREVREGRWLEWHLHPRRCDLDGTEHRE